MKKLLALSLLLIIGGSNAGVAFLGFGSIAPTTPPVNITPPQISSGRDLVGDTLGVTAGTYSGSPATLTYSWHMVNGSSLGTGTTFGPLTSAMVTACSGSTDPACGRVQVDEIATNGAGSITTRSMFIGPVEASLPQMSFMIIGTGLGSATVTIGGVSATITSQTATNIQGLIPQCSPQPSCTPVPWPTSSNTVVSSGTLTTVGFGALNLVKALPQYPGHWLQNGHAVCPGCNIPPSVNTSTGTHVWYFDGVTGGTQTSGKTGHAGSPFKDPNAIFATTAGYNGGTAPLFPTEILPGDEVYIKGCQTYSPQVFLNPTNQYSTSTGAINGVPLWTWIEQDPSCALKPVLSGISISGGSDWVFKNLAIENNGKASGTYALGYMLHFAASAANPLYDIMAEGIAGSGWIGHSNDAANIVTYPTSGGQFDGTIQTASPYVGDYNTTPAYTTTATTAAPTKLFFPTATMPIMGTVANSSQVVYVWPPGYYRATGGTGIPPGTKLVDYVGVAGVSFQGSATAATILAKTKVIQQGWLASDTNDFYIGCQEPNPAVLNCTTGTSLIWADQGPAWMTIGTCDPVTDAATGCPSAIYTNPNGGGTNGTPFVQCDPLVIGRGTGGCSAGTAPTWTGVTRNITNEAVEFTQYMVVKPAGWWNHLDWDYAYNGPNGTTSFGTNNIDPSNPNDVVGMFGISVKDNVFRNMATGWAFGNAHDVVMYNSRISYVTSDAGDVYSSHRVLAINNIASDFTFELAHPDIIQFAFLGGGGITNDSQFYGDVVVDDEGYSAADANDPFQDFVQPVIDVTNCVYSDMYAANNINFNSLAPVNTGGVYNVEVQNDILGDGDFGGFGWMKFFSGAQSSAAFANQPQFTLIGNNITNSMYRNSLIQWFTATGTGFGASAGTISVAGIPVQAILSWSNTQITATTPGAYGATTPTTGNITVSSGTVSGVTTATAATNCAADQLTAVGNQIPTSINYTTGALAIPFNGPCNGTGIQDFVTTQGAYTGQDVWSTTDWRTEIVGANSPFLEFHPLPSVPTSFIAVSPCIQNGFDIGGCGPVAGPGVINLRPNPSFVSHTNPAASPYQPPIIGGGTNLGLQGSPANHDRAAWTNPPNVGAY